MRLELAGAIQALCPPAADPEGFARHRIPYAEKAVSFLAPWRAHAAVELHQGPLAKAFKFSDRRQVLLRLSRPPELLERLTVEYALADRAGGPQALRAWLESLRDFARETRFEDFFFAEARLLDPAVKEFRRREARVDFVRKIEEYGGLPLRGRHLVFLSPWDAPGGVANHVAKLEDGSMEISSVIGPAPTRDGITFWSERVPGTLWHELAHGILDRLTDVHASEVDRRSERYPELGWDCYGQWRQCVREHVVRAVMIRLLARELGEAEASSQLAFEGEKKYRFLPPLLERLREYENSRTRYPNLSDYYPVLLKAFDPQNAGARRAPPGAAAPSDSVREPSGLEPNAAPEAPAAMAERKELAVQLYLKGDYLASLRESDAALAKRPDDPETLLTRGAVLQALRRRREALDSYTGAIRVIEDRRASWPEELLANALSSRSSVWIELERRDQARTDLRRALEEAPRGWTLRAEAERRLGELAP